MLYCIFLLRGTRPRNGPGAGLSQSYCFQTCPSLDLGVATVLLAVPCSGRGNPASRSGDGAVWFTFYTRSWVLQIVYYFAGWYVYNQSLRGLGFIPQCMFVLGGRATLTAKYGIWVIYASLFWAPKVRCGVFDRPLKTLFVMDYQLICSRSCM